MYKRKYTRVYVATGMHLLGGKLTVDLTFSPEKPMRSRRLRTYTISSSEDDSETEILRPEKTVPAPRYQSQRSPDRVYHKPRSPVNSTYPPPRALVSTGQHQAQPEHIFQPQTNLVTAVLPRRNNQMQPSTQKRDVLFSPNRNALGIVSHPISSAPHSSGASAESARQPVTRRALTTNPTLPNHSERPPYLSESRTPLYDYEVGPTRPSSSSLFCPYYSSVLPGHYYLTLFQPKIEPLPTSSIENHRANVPTAREREGSSQEGITIETITLSDTGDMLSPGGDKRNQTDEPMVVIQSWYLS